jgi:hypothetical protein
MGHKLKSSSGANIVRFALKADSMRRQIGVGFVPLPDIVPFEKRAAR